MAKKSKEWQFKNYRDGLSAITMIALHYDGYNPKDAKQMKGLVDQLAELAGETLLDKPVFIKCDGKSMYNKDGNYRK